MKLAYVYGEATLAGRAPAESRASRGFEINWKCPQSYNQAIDLNGFVS